MINNKFSNNLRSYKGISPNLGKSNYIDDSAIIVGDVALADDVSIWPLVAARGDVNSIKIGARTNVQDGTVLHVTRRSEHNPNGNPLIIGEWPYYILFWEVIVLMFTYSLYVISTRKKV